MANESAAMEPRLKQELDQTGKNIFISNWPG
jgi:hypothetical protein